MMNRFELLVILFGLIFMAMITNGNNHKQNVASNQNRRNEEETCSSDQNPNKSCFKATKPSLPKESKESKATKTKQDQINMNDNINDDNKIDYDEEFKKPFNHEPPRQSFSLVSLLNRVLIGFAYLVEKIIEYFDWVKYKLFGNSDLKRRAEIVLKKTWNAILEQIPFSGDHLREELLNLYMHASNVKTS